MIYESITMSKEPENVAPWCRNLVYLFRQGGPTLISIVCMGAVAWQAMTQVTNAVGSLQVCVERSNAVLLKFMETVEIDHRSQMNTLKDIQSQIKQNPSTSFNDTQRTYGTTRD